MCSFEHCHRDDDSAAGASALKRGRGELPGRSACGHGVASPCGNLWSVSINIVEVVLCDITVVLDLLVVFDRHLYG